MSNDKSLRHKEDPPRCLFCNSKKVSERGGHDFTGIGKHLKHYRCSCCNLLSGFWDKRKNNNG